MVKFCKKGNKMIQQELDKLLKDIKNDAELKKKVLATKDSSDPLMSFCNLCKKKDIISLLGK